MGTLGDYYVYEDRDTFYTALANFTADGDNGRFVSDIIYNDDGQIQVRFLIHIYSMCPVDGDSHTRILQDFPQNGPFLAVAVGSDQTDLTRSDQRDLEISRLDL